MRRRSQTTRLGKLEEGFNVDTGSLGQNGLLFGRQAYVGLTGAFGQVRLGRQKTVMYDAVLAVDPFGIANKGGMDRLFVTNTSELVNTATAIRGVGRSNNTIAYFTPNVAGFTGEVTYTLGEQANNNQYGRQYGISLNYAAGPLFVTLDYLNVNSVPVVAPLVVNSISDSTARTTFLGATYDFGIAKAHAAYGIDKGSVNVSPAVGGVDQRDFMVGATIPFGASAVQVDYIRKLDRAGQNAGAKQYALGYTYALSKRTNFYSSYTGTNLNSVNYVANGVPNQIDRVLNLGVRHTF